MMARLVCLRELKNSFSTNRYHFSYLVCYLDIAIWLLSTFVNSSCDVKINLKNSQNCCINLAVKGF